MATSTSSGGALRAVLVLASVAFLLLMAIVIVRNIIFGSSPSAQDPADDVAGTVVVVPSESASSTAAGIACGRPADGAGDGAFLIDVAADLATENVIVAIDLVGPDGSRDRRLVNVAPAEAGQARQVIVADSNDQGRYTACVVTAIQQDRKVIITGR
jgi:hypothetical protein